jgi:hypothetical protein
MEITLNSRIVDLPVKPWTLSSCVAEANRDDMARFWLAAPSDQLEALWSSAAGEVTRQLVRQLTPQTTFTAAQVALREAINARFQQDGLSQPLGPQLMLANFLYSPPGLLKINGPEHHLPPWLAGAYRHLYETVAPARPGLSGASVAPHQAAAPSPDFGSFPSTLQELVGNRIQLNRMLGLSNLYYIDPEDREIFQELQQLRAQLASAILSCPEHQLEQLWGTDLGDRYWAMVRSGVQREPLNSTDQALKQRIVDQLNPALGGGFGRPAATNAFLVAMLFFEPGTMQVESPEQKLSAWLLPHYQQIFAQQPALQS